MARVKIDLPTTWLYELDLPVRITDINYGQHLGNDAFLAMIQEARVRWLHQFGWTELRILEGVGLIMVDLAIRFKHEAVFGDLLTIRLAATEWTDVGFELTYQAVKKDGGAEVARAQSGLVFFDYRTRKLSRVPPGFRERVEAGA